jgi:hypothetical protein
MLSPTPRDNQGDDVSRLSGCIHGVQIDNLTNDVHLHRQRPTSPPQLQVDHDGVHHISWPPKDIGYYSMRYNLGIMVSVISIFKEFEFVTSITCFDYVTFYWTLFSFPCFTLVVDIAP